MLRLLLVQAAEVGVEIVPDSLKLDSVVEVDGDHRFRTLAKTSLVEHHVEGVSPPLLLKPWSELRDELFEGVAPDRVSRELSMKLLNHVSEENDGRPFLIHRKSE